MADDGVAPRGRTTLRDVAERAGVSRTTASFVLNNRTEMRISEAAQERVRRAARELDYRPNLAARALSTQMTNTIALLSDGVTTDGYTAQIVEGCLRAAVARSRMLFVGEFRGDRRLRDRLMASFIDHQVDGFLYATASTQRVSLPTALAGTPVVVVNGRVRGTRVPTVIPDDHGGAVSLARHLLELGHRDDIWILGELPAELAGADERKRGLLGTLADGGVRPSGFLPCKWWPESAFDSLGTALDEGVRPRAVVCLNDRVALGAYQALTERGVAIPADTTVVSFDDSPLSSWLHPHLTSARLPHTEIGERAVEVLLEGDLEGVEHRLPMPLHVRESSGPPR